MLDSEPSWNSVSSEILLRVFSFYVLDIRDLYYCSLVSKRWERMIRDDPTFWQLVCTRTWKFGREVTIVFIFYWLTSCSLHYIIMIGDLIGDLSPKREKRLANIFCREFWIGFLPFI
jgi:hypothetical protein